MKEPILFIGSDKTISDIIYFANHNNCFGINVLNTIDSDDLFDNKKLNQLKRYLKITPLKTVIIAQPTMPSERLFKLIDIIQPLVRNVMFVPNTRGIPIYNLEVKKLFESNILLLGIKNNLTKTSNYILKRIFDICFSLLGMIVILPVSLIICICILIESPGAAPIFKHYRVGRMGKLFPCYKFRSMIPHAQEKLKDYLAKNPEAQREWNTFYKLKNDPRITKVGKILRKTSLDELPQIINVLKGEMSLVGPRPIIKDELHYYGKNVRDYYSVLPGITGMWQANGRSDTGYAERVSLDVWYIRNWSIWIDIALICKTIKAVFCGKGAY